MKGISYIVEGNHHKKAIVIELKMLEENKEDIHDLIDSLIAESRKNDEMIDWEVAKNKLRAAGKL